MRREKEKQREGGQRRNQEEKPEREAGKSNVKKAKLTACMGSLKLDKVRSLSRPKGPLTSSSASERYHLVPGAIRWKCLAGGRFKLSPRD
jgi:hypothetical protein